MLSSSVLLQLHALLSNITTIRQFFNNSSQEIEASCIRNAWIAMTHATPTYHNDASFLDFLEYAETRIGQYLNEIPSNPCEHSVFSEREDILLDTLFILSQKHSSMLERSIHENIHRIIGNTTIFKQTLSLLFDRPELQRYVLVAGEHLVTDNEIAFVAALRSSITDIEFFKHILQIHPSLTATTPETLRDLLQIFGQANREDLLHRVIADNTVSLSGHAEFFAIAILAAEHFPEVQRAIIQLGSSLVIESEGAFGALLIATIEYDTLLTEVSRLRPSLTFTQVNLFEGALRLFARKRLESYLDRLIQDNIPLLEQHPHALRIALRETATIPSVFSRIVMIAMERVIRTDARGIPDDLYREILTISLSHAPDMTAYIDRLLTIDPESRHHECLAVIIESIPKDRPDILLSIVERNAETIRKTPKLRKILKKYLGSGDQTTISIREILRRKQI